MLNPHYMRIAQIAPIVERVPPKKYGGTERIVSALTEELVQRGHEVTLFATGDSLTKAKLSHVHEIALREAKLENIYGLNTWTMYHIGEAYAHQRDFDIIHDHTGYIGLPTANIAQTLVVITMHGNFNEDVRPIFEALRHPHIACISKAQASVLNLRDYSVVYNGLPMEHYPFSEQHDGYLLFVGRISLEKGTHNAIEVARKLNLPLIIAAKLDEPDKKYYLKHVKPYLNEKIKWIGEVDEVERNRLMSKALCFLHPVTWNEPFGLTMIEAMACGCPVIAYDKGSIPEVVKDGKTGYVVKDASSLLDAVAHVDRIRRIDCREHALKNFSASKMADRYEELYHKILNHP